MAAALAIWCCPSSTCSLPPPVVAGGIEERKEGEGRREGIGQAGGKKTCGEEQCLHGSSLPCIVPVALAGRLFLVQEGRRERGGEGGIEGGTPSVEGTGNEAGNRGLEVEVLALGAAASCDVVNPVLEHKINNFAQQWQHCSTQCQDFHSHDLTERVHMAYA